MKPEDLKKYIAAYGDLNIVEQKLIMLDSILDSLKLALSDCIKQGKDEDLTTFELITLGLQELYMQELQIQASLLQQASDTNQKLGENVVPFPKKKSEDPTFH